MFKNLIIYNDFSIQFYDKLNILFIISQECSRKCLDWDLCELEITLNFPDSIECFLLLYDFLVLCGGSVINELLGFKIRDYDFFFLCDHVTMNNFLINIRKKYKFFETENAVSIYHEGCRIQFIKRTYLKIEHILGGFDLDSCKFAYKHTNKTEKVYYTNLSYLSVKFSKNFINLNNQSKTFLKRIKKYSRSIFSPYNIYDENKKVKTYKNDENYSYSIYISKHDSHKNFEKDINICYLLQKKYHKLYYSQKVYSLEEFEKHIEKDSYGKSNVCKVNSNKFLYKKRYISYFEEEKENKIDKCSSNEKIIRKYLIKKRYHYYENISSLKISNTYSQFSGCFYKTNLKKEDFCNNYVKINFLDFFPEILYLLKNFLPKYLRYKITKNYVNILIKDLQEKKKGNSLIQNEKYFNNR